MKLRYSPLLIALLITAPSAQAMEFLFVDMVASRPAVVRPTPTPPPRPVDDNDDGNVPVVIEEEPASNPVPVALPDPEPQPEPTPPPPVVESEPEPQIVPVPVANPDPIPLPDVVAQPVEEEDEEEERTPDERDVEILSVFEEFSEEEEVSEDQQEELLDEGITVTGISSLAETLTPQQREVILRQDVETVSQLQLFVRAAAEENEDIRKIEVDHEGVAVTVTFTADLFGFIPMDYLAEANVSEDLTVDVDAPWWLFFAMDDVDEVQQQAEREIRLTIVPDEEDDNVQETVQERQQSLVALLNVIGRF